MESATQTAADVLEATRDKYPGDGFIIIAIKRIKHPNDGDDVSSIALASNLEGWGEVLYWLGDIALQVAADPENFKRQNFKKP